MSAQSTERRFLYCAIGEGKHRAALRETCDFAEKVGAQVDVISVVEPASRWDRLAHGGYVDQVQAESIDQLTRAVKRWKRDLAPIGDTTVTVGTIGDTVISAIEDNGAEMLVLAAPESRADLLATQRLLRLSPCSVWVVRPTRAKNRRVMAAVNPEIPELDLNLAIMADATQFADQLNAELYLFSAWQLYGQETLRRSAFIHTTIGEYDDLYDLREKVTAEGLHELAARTQDAERWTEVLTNGIAAPSILDAVQANRINLLVMGTVGRSGLSGLLMGNTAESVLETIRCSLLSVRTPSPK